MSASGHRFLETVRKRWQNAPDGGHPLFGVLVILTAVVFLSGYVLGGVGDVEDFNSTGLTTYLFMRSLFAGDNPLWTPLLGLGLPQPFRISLIQHPLGFLFAFLGPLAAIKTIVFAQGVIGAAGFYLLSREFGMPRPVAATCAISYILSTAAVEYLFFDDFFSTFLSYCLYPLIIYAFLLIVRAGQGVQVWTPALALGLWVGLLVATGLASHVASYLLVIVAFILVPPDILRLRWVSLAISASVCILISLGVLTLLTTELVQFPPNLPRTPHGNPPLTSHLFGALGTDYWLGLTGGWTSFSRVVLADNHRTTGFGPVAAMVATVAIFLPLGREGVRVKAAFVAAVIFLVLPPAFYIDVISATWVFRDSINVFGVLLFGLACAKLGERGRARWILRCLCVAQCVIVVLFAFPPWYRAIENWHSPATHPHNVAQPATGGPFTEQLKAIVGGDPGRLLFSPKLGMDVRRNNLARYGVASNTLAFFDLTVVDTFARGIATSALHPDSNLMEGFIGTTGENMRDQDFLDVLGVSFVLARTDELVSSRLESAGIIALEGQTPIAVWRNPTAWPSVVQVAPNATNVHLKTRPGCGHDRFLCADFAPLKDSLQSAPTTAFVRRGGELSFSLSPTGQERLLLINTWYRPAWTSKDSRVTVLPLFGQFIGVQISPGVSEVTLSYRPRGLMLAYGISSATIVLVIGTILVLLVVTRRRHMRSVRAAASV